ncbi:MAG TPA: sigma-54 dependent transcriptional regulator [Myxococcaceae bacterium]|nr:sigma-54 dependent transcriptional regulator [Myxococcaceae bacterium]
MSLAILLIDDDRAFSGMAAAALQREGFPVTVARSLHEARKSIEKSAADLVILDRRLPDGDGLSLLAELKSQLPDAVVIMVTAHGDIASAVDAIRAGAADYLTKPVELADLVMKARRSAEQIRLRDRLQQVEAEISSRSRFTPPRSEVMKRVVEMMERIATAPRSPVLFLGQTGVGKEVLARHIHALANRDDAPFVHVNCAALPATTVENELFGHERGAFTDARSTRRGLVEVASGGTLFLDEIAEMPQSVQAKLLTFLDSGRFRRLGGTSEQSSTARIMAATNRDQQSQMGGVGSFREDLWFRLSVFRIEVPPLRERREDVIPLAESILEGLRPELGKKNAQLGERARARLLRYSFPGNIRELKNILERALVLETGPELELDFLEPTLAGQPPARPGGADFVVSGQPVTLDEIEKRYARHVLSQLGGRRVEAAKALGLSYPTFLKKIGE